MKRPLTYSALLHLTVLILLLIGFYNPFESKRTTETPMMIEFVQVAEQSAAPVLAPEVIKEVEQPEPPKPTPTPTPPPMPTPSEPTPQPQPEIVKPEPPKPDPKPEETKPEDAEPIPDPKAKEKPKEKPKEKKPEKQKVDITLDKKKKPTPKPDEQKDDQKKDKKKKPSKSPKPSKTLDDIMNEVENEKENNDDGAPSRGKGAPAATIGPVLTASEKDALSRHMSRCWIIPSGLRDAKNIRVPIKINVARDGTVQKAEIQEKGRMATDAAYRTAAESARRAVLDPNCSPLPIPQDKYEIFKEFVFNFDPKEMF